MRNREQFWRQRAADLFGAVFAATGAGILALLNHTAPLLGTALCVGTACAWMFAAPLGRWITAPRPRSPR